MFLPACAQCCPCSGSPRSSQWPSCTWLAASVSLTYRSGRPSIRHGAGGSSLSRMSQLSCLKVLIMPSCLPYNICFISSQIFLSKIKKKTLSFRHLPPDLGLVLSGQQTDSSANAGEGAGSGPYTPCSSSSTGTTSGHQPSSSTTKEDFPTGWQPYAPAQTFTCECVCVS